MKEIERRFILERTYNSWKLNTYVFNEKDELVDVYFRENVTWKDGDRPAGRVDMPETQMELLDSMREVCMRKSSPVLYPERDGIYYVGFVDAQNWMYLFGPFSTEEISFGQLLSYRKRHKIYNQEFRISVKSFAKVINTVVLLYYMVTGNCVTEEEMFEVNNLSKVEKLKFSINRNEVMIYEIEESMEGKRRLAYRDELKWAAEIENGTRVETKKMFHQENLEKLKMIGTFSNKNAFKQYEYLLITSACLACRAAIRGGMNVYDAYALTDVFYQKISMCTDIMELLELYVQIPDEFSSQVQKIKEHRSPYIVEQCQDYIARNHTKKFSLQDLATELNKSPTYLSRIFSEETGNTLKEYALSVRLEAGANLLKYSDRSVGDIAEYLHFSSQSYFSEYFKKKYMLTPLEYRNQNKVRDFRG